MTLERHSCRAIWRSEDQDAGPNCGRSDALCDCLRSAAPGNPADGVTVPAAAPAMGRPAEALAGVVFDQGDGLGSTAFESLDGQAGTPGIDGADSLLQFLRDSSSASLKASPVGAAAQLGRNRPVGRGPGDGDPRDQGPVGRWMPPGTSPPLPRLAGREGGDRLSVFPGPVGPIELPGAGGATEDRPLRTFSIG